MGDRNGDNVKHAWSNMDWWHGREDVAKVTWYTKWKSSINLADSSFQLSSAVRFQSLVFFVFFLFDLSNLQVVLSYQISLHKFC